MITQPSCSRYLEVVRQELRATVGPAVTDPAAQAALGMIDSILAGVMTRCDHEVAWMREEIADIEACAATVIAAAADTDGRVADSLTRLRTHRSPTDHTEDVRAEYDLAGEVLSRALEAGLSAGGETTSVVRDALRRRLAREMQIRGDFSLVGR